MPDRHGLRVEADVRILRQLTHHLGRPVALVIGPVAKTHLRWAGLSSGPSGKPGAKVAAAGNRRQKIELTKKLGSGVPVGSAAGQTLQDSQAERGTSYAAPGKAQARPLGLMQALDHVVPEVGFGPGGSPPWLGPL